MKRESGILLPISSLPSPYGIGCFSREAYEFVDQLKEAGQSYWQILPLGPTSYGDSPYQSFSTFAGNPYFIDLDILIEDHKLAAVSVSHCSTDRYPAYPRWRVRYSPDLSGCLKGPLSIQYGCWSDPRSR